MLRRADTPRGYPPLKRPVKHQQPAIAAREGGVRDLTARTALQHGNDDGNRENEEQTSATQGTPANLAAPRTDVCTDFPYTTSFHGKMPRLVTRTRKDGLP